MTIYTLSIVGALCSLYETMEQTRQEMEARSATLGSDASHAGTSKR
jgi:hypothetical protein